MGWNVSLMNENGVVQVAPHFEGGIITVGGNTWADMSVTWNYAPFYYQTIDKEKGFRWLDEKTAKESIPRLEKALKTLGANTSNDYWEATPGNAGRILDMMLEWAKQKPDAVWEIS